jgi:hypothetical protein
MKLRSQIVERLLKYAILIFVLSFLWEFFTGDNFYQALQDAFAVFLLSLFIPLIIEIVVWYQTNRTK